MEKKRIVLVYDNEAHSVNYEQGIVYQLSDIHQVLATEQEFDWWLTETSY